MIHWRWWGFGGLRLSGCESDVGVWRAASLSFSLQSSRLLSNTLMSETLLSLSDLHCPAFVSLVLRCLLFRSYNSFREAFAGQISHIIYPRRKSSVLLPTIAAPNHRMSFKDLHDHYLHGIDAIVAGSSLPASWFLAPPSHHAPSPRQRPPAPSDLYRLLVWTLRYAEYKHAEHSDMLNTQTC